MSFATEILKPAAAHVVLFQIDIGKLETVWSPIASGVWITNFNNLYACEDTFTDIPDNIVLSQIGSVSANGIQLSKVYSPASCITQDSSFYWEAGTKTLYVHCPLGNDPDLFKILVGQVYGFRKGGQTAIYGGVDFQDRLIDVPAISYSKDPQFYGTITFESANIKIINADHKYEFLTRDQNVFGNKARILVGFDGWPLTDFQQRYEGTVGKITTNQEAISVEVKDQRWNLSKAINDNVFTTTDYPNLDQSDIGKPLPRVFGECRNVPIYVYDKSQTTDKFSPSTDIYHCKIADTAYTSAISDIVAIYVNGSAVTSTGEDLSLKEFTLKHTTAALTNKYNPGDEVTADIIGEVDSNGDVIKNGAYVIRKLLFDYYDIPYTGDFFNQAAWFENQARDICLWIGEQDGLIDVINQICADGIQGDFYLDGTGKFNLRIYNINNPIVQTIRRNQILETPEIDDDPTQILTSTLIGYNKDWANDEFYLLLDTSQEATIFDNYPHYAQQRFDSLAQDIIEAQNYSDNVMDKSGDIQTIIKVRCPGWSIVNRNIGEFVTAYIDYPNSDWYQRCKCEIIGIDFNFNDHIISLTLRLIQRLDDIPYTESFFYNDNYFTGSGKTFYGNTYYSKTINDA